MLSASCHCGTARALQSYSRGRALYFDHCRRCGCVMLWRLKAARGTAGRLGVNMRMLDDPGALTLKRPWW